MSLLFSASSISAQGYEFVGHGRLFSNDLLGDGRDRWRSGAYGLSFVWDRGGQSSDLRHALDTLELRLRSELITPASLTSPAPNDRRYAGILSVGVHTHLREQAFQARLGVDLVMTGPQTRLDQLQKAVHRKLGLAVPAPAVLNNQIGNAVHLAFSGDLAWNASLSDTLRLRPFAEWEIGLERLVRAGADVIIGDFGRQGILIRDPSLGQLYLAGHRASGVSFLIGADTAYVGRSALLSTTQLRHQRHRARLGLSWQGRRTEAFYGVTWLSPEFVGQGQSQIVGSVRLSRVF